MLIKIVDNKMGNLRSVYNAFNAIEQPAVIVHDPAELRDADAVILPGVGAFGDAITNLKEMGWLDALEEEVRSKQKPFLGICVGMQLLAANGTEHGLFKGMGWIPGRVERLQPPDPQHRIPHIGWNDVHFVKQDGLFSGLGDAADFYFVHSYALVPEDSDHVSATCTHGVEFTAAVERDNIYATQFHLEKSQNAGLTVLRNFVALAEKAYA